MAVDYKGQPLTQQTAFTTTGIMNKKPAVLKPLKMPTQKAVEEKATPQRVDQPKVNLENLKDDDKRILNIHLTPSFKRVLSQVFGEDLFPGMGRKEPTVILPAKLVAEKFGSIDNFRSLIKEDDNVPPSQGNMTSPQTT